MGYVFSRGESKSVLSSIEESEALLLSPLALYTKSYFSSCFVFIDTWVCFVFSSLTQNIAGNI